MFNHHLTSFSIQNYKRFESLVVNNIGQFNLIVGDNNVGKTSLLEALILGDTAKDVIRGFLYSLLVRNLLPTEFDEKFPVRDAWEHIFQKREKPMIVKFDQEKWIYTLTQKLDEEDLKQEDSQFRFNYALAGETQEYLRVITSKGDRYFVVSDALGMYQQATSQKRRFHLVPVFKFYNDDLVELFSEPSKDKNIRKKIIEGLQKIVTGLEDIRVITQNGKTQLSLDIEGEKQSIPLARFGDGAIKTFRLLLEIIAASGKRLMVDEIETGLHWTRQRSFWKTIIRLCEEHDVQLFATTHSLECQQSFMSVLEEEDMRRFQSKARNISLIENVKGSVQTVTFDFKQFKYALEVGFNTRGGGQ